MKVSSANSIWLSELRGIFDIGTCESRPRGLDIYEVIGTNLWLDMNYPILTINERRLNYKFMAGEAFWILSGDNSVDGIARYCKEMAGYSDDGVTLFGAYGPRIFNQMPYILVKLRQDIHSRQAVINIWRESPPLDTKNPPCDTQLQFLIRDDKLHLVLTSCSSDIWRGLPYDIFNFVMVTTWLLFDLKGKYHDLELGYLYYNIGSLHLYKTDEVEAKIIVDSHNSYSLEYQDFVFNWRKFDDGQDLICWLVTTAQTDGVKKAVERLNE